eukprot:6183323-Pleurochrysis_carterae.AAC.5
MNGPSRCTPSTAAPDACDTAADPACAGAITQDSDVGLESSKGKKRPPNAPVSKTESRTWAAQCAQRSKRAGQEVAHTYAEVHTRTYTRRASSCQKTERRSGDAKWQSKERKKEEQTGSARNGESGVRTRPRAKPTVRSNAKGGARGAERDRGERAHASKSACKGAQAGVRAIGEEGEGHCDCVKITRERRHQTGRKHQTSQSNGQEERAQLKMSGKYDSKRWRAQRKQRAEASVNSHNFRRLARCELRQVGRVRACERACERVVVCVRERA